VPVVMATNRTGGQAGRSPPRARVAAFTLIDLLVSLAIIGVLIGILLPTLSGVREATRKVICTSNIRQHGLGLAMYAEDNHGQFPESNYLPKGVVSATYPQNTNVARRDVTNPAAEYAWDGLGVLFDKEYLHAPQVFYCPSHHGQYPMAGHVGDWSADAGKIVMNYQYRGDELTAGQLVGRALVTDGLATREDFNHTVGANVLRLDYSVGWVADTTKMIFNNLPDPNDVQAAPKVLGVWNQLDSAR
jgi:type II secretory pathway pseudopilin PulG